MEDLTNEVHNELWCKQKLLVLLNYIYKNQNKQIYKQLFYNVLFTIPIQYHLTNILLINNDVILRIYWEEFKLVRLHIKQEYDNTIQKICDQTTNLHKYVVELFEQEHILVDKKNIFGSVKDYVNNNKNNSNTQCKICMDRNVNRVLEHNNHVCTICYECSLKIDKENGCPFCKDCILNVKKLFIR